MADAFVREMAAYDDEKAKLMAEAEKEGMVLRCVCVCVFLCVCVFVCVCVCTYEVIFEGECLEQRAMSHEQRRKGWK